MKAEGVVIGFDAFIGAAIGLLFMPMLGPLALVAGAAIGALLSALMEARRGIRSH
jgi:uncharacterized membrane protein